MRYEKLQDDKDFSYEKQQNKSLFSTVCRSGFAFFVLILFQNFFQNSNAILPAVVVQLLEAQKVLTCFRFLYRAVTWCHYNSVH